MEFGIANCLMNGRAGALNDIELSLDKKRWILVLTALNACGGQSFKRDELGRTLSLNGNIFCCLS